jgi:hypothetical protein
MRFEAGGVSSEGDIISAIICIQLGFCSLGT